MLGIGKPSFNEMVNLPLGNPVCVVGVDDGH